MIYTRPTLAALLLGGTKLIAGAIDGPFAGCKIALFTNALAPNVDTEWEDLTEAAFTGYVRSTAVVWGAAALNSSETGVPVIAGDNKTFTCTGTAVEEACTGYAIVEEDGADVIVKAIQMFDEPENMSNGQSIVISPRIGLDQTAKVPGGDVVLT